MNKTTTFFLILFMQFTGLAILTNTVYAENKLQNTLQADIEITGNVYDSATKEAIVGATIYIKNTTSGTTTDVNGHYSINIPTPQSVLVFSFIGYQNQELVVGDRRIIDVALMVRTEEIEQVVIIGYGVQKKVDLTGAISTVDTKGINLMPVMSVAQAVQGKAAGVQIIQNSGSPGSSTTVNIRGMGTINNSEPLYVVDGMPLEDIRFLSIDDVKDITILKDAASCSIYGSRGSNGVILLTTKRGESGKVKIDFSTNFSVNSFWKTYDLMGTNEWLDTRKQYYSGTQFEDYTKIFTTKYAVDDWFGAVTNNFGTNQKYNLTISGGSEKTKYLVSATNSKDNGIVDKTSYRQSSFRINLDNRLNDKITLQTNLNFTNSAREITLEGKDNVFQQVLRQPPVDRFYETIYENVNKPDSVVLGPSYNWGSLYAKVQTIDHTQTTNNLTGGLSLEINPSKAVSFISRANIYGNYFEDNYFNKSTKSYLYPMSDSDKNAVAKQSKVSQTYRWSWENILHSTFKLNEVHHFDLTGVASMEGQYYHELSARRYGYISDISALEYLNTGDNIDFANEWAKLYTTMSFVGRIIYNFSDRYNIQVNARNDGSSFFAKDIRWGFFPSVSAGWSVSNETFMKNLKLNWLALFKIRASYGILGNNRIEEYSNYDLVKPLGYYLYGRNPSLNMGWSMSGYGNQDIVWEKTKTTNLGFDLNLFENKLTSSIDLYEKYTSDMLLQVPLPYSIGVGEGTNSPWQNTGEVKNTGLDLSMSYKENIGKFSYKASMNFTKFVNKVVKLGERDEPVYGAKIDDYYVSNYLGYLTYTAPGYPISQFYGYKTDGIFSTEEEPYIKNTPQGYNKKEGINMPQAGDFKFKDLNGDGKIDNGDMTILGSPQPDFLYGFSFDLTYSGFDLNVAFQGSYGNQIFNVTKFFSNHFYAESFGGKPNNPVSGLDNLSWTPENESRLLPAIKPNDFNNNYRASDFYIEDGSYMRLKNLQLGYNFAPSVLNKIGISNLRLFLGGYNLLTFTKYSGLDPEIGKDVSNTSNNLFYGIDRGNYPIARSYTFGVVMGL